MILCFFTAVNHMNSWNNLHCVARQICPERPQDLCFHPLVTYPKWGDVLYSHLFIIHYCSYIHQIATLFGMSKNRDFPVISGFPPNCKKKKKKKAEHCTINQSQQAWSKQLDYAPWGDMSCKYFNFSSSIAIISKSFGFDLLDLETSLLSSCGSTNTI